MNNLTKSYTIQTLVSVLHDAPTDLPLGKKQEILSVYFIDLYKLLLTKLSKFESATEYRQNEVDHMINMFKELCDVKKLLIERTIH